MECRAQRGSCLSRLRSLHVAQSARSTKILTCSLRPRQSTSAIQSLSRPSRRSSSCGMRVPYVDHRGSPLKPHRLICVSVLTGTRWSMPCPSKRANNCSSRSAANSSSDTTTCMGLDPKYVQSGLCLQRPCNCGSVAMLQGYSLELVERRYAWFRNFLREYDMRFANVLPPHWDVARVRPCEHMAA